MALVSLEIGLHIYNPIESRVKGDKIVLPANRRYVYENSHLRGIDETIVHTKNSIGFRGSDLPDDGLENHLSIIVIGGSTTECVFQSDDKVWTALLEKSISGDFREVWVNNAGLDGHSTFGHTILLEDIILKLHPKILIFLIGANDLARKEVNEQGASQIKGTLRFNSLEGFVKSVSAYSELASLTLNFYRYLRAKSNGLPHSNLDVKAMPQVDPSDLNHPSALEPHINTYVPAYKRRLRYIVRLAKDSQIDLVLVTQPSLFGAGIDPVTGVDLGTLKLPQGSSQTYWTTLELYNQATKKIGKQEDILTIDLARALGKSSDFFYDALHFTNQGSRIVSEIIYKHLRPYLMENYGSFSKAKD